MTDSITFGINLPTLLTHMASTMKTIRWTILIFALFHSDLQAQIQIGVSRKRTPIQMYQIGDGPKVALYFAGIHGNEPAGVDLLTRLKGHLQANPTLTKGWTVLIVPCLNPDGIMADSRCNSNHVDLNRNFPEGHENGVNPNSAELCGDKEHPCTNGKILKGKPEEPEAAALFNLVMTRKPIRILSLHQRTSDAPHGKQKPLKECKYPSGHGTIDVDPKGSPIGSQISKRIVDKRNEREKSFILSSPKVDGGSFGRWAGNLKPPIITITYELSILDKVWINTSAAEATKIRERNWANNMDALLEFLK